MNINEENLYELLQNLISQEKLSNVEIDIVNSWIEHKNSDRIISVGNDDVYWEMEWDQERFPDKPKNELIFEPNQALASLLINEVILLNSHWWEEKWNKKEQNKFYISVICSDIFAWGCCDSEEMGYNELQDVYDHWLKDNAWGPAIWCIKKRNELPQKPVYDAIMKAGIWNLDEMGLKENQYDKLLKENSKNKT